MVMKRQAPRGRKHRQANAEQLQRERSIERASSTLSNLVKEAQVLLGATPDDDQLKRHLQSVLANFRRAQSLQAELETVTDLKTPKNRAMKAALRAEQTRLDAESRTAWKALSAAKGELGLAVEVRKNKAIREGCAQLASRAKSLTWQVLPPGGWKKFLSSPYARHVDEAAPQFCPERLAVLDTFGPQEWYAGSQLGHTVYMVAIFDRFAVADTPERGNALYYCPVDAGGWKTVFQLAKAEALQGGARRIVHTAGWQMQVSKLLVH